MSKSNNSRTVSFSTPSLTHQSFKDECDIGNIMKRYLRTGVLTHLTSLQARYGDLSNLPDYHTALNTVIQAQDSFDALPAVIRARFFNDPGQFMDFVSNPENRDEMVKLGMIESQKQDDQSLAQPIRSEAAP